MYFLLLLLYFRIIAYVLSNFFPNFSQVFPIAEHKGVYVSIIAYSSAVNAPAIFPLPLTGGRGCYTIPPRRPTQPPQEAIIQHRGRFMPIIHKLYN